MEKSIHYIPAGVCSQTIDITVEDGIVKEVYFEGGCHGNLQGISFLLKGKKIGEVINRLEGIHCGYKNTSCPDQFAKALRILEQK